MNKIKIFKSVAQKIISFLAQLEELQKKLWEKKKFVIETNYCITLDKIDEDYYEEIFACKEQLAEWKKLFDVEVQSIEDLKEEKYLVLDTKFFDMKFKYSLLAEFDNLDVDIDGVLINSENFGALNLLQSRYKEKVKTVYIDPPYNTGSDGFLYNDSYQHSSWMSFMYDRMALSRELMSNLGAIFSSIDDREQTNLKMIKNTIFGENNFISNIIWNQKNVVQNDAKFVSTNHEHLLSFRKTDKLQNFNLLPRTEEMNSRYSNPDNDPRGDWTSVALQAKSGSEANLYDITFPNGVYWKPVSGTYPRLSKDSLLKAYEDNRLWFGKTGTNVPRLKKFLTEVKQGVISNSIWKNEEVGSTQYGKENLKSILDTNIFQTPKTTGLIERAIVISSTDNSTILDYFAGSGTTGHAVINLNREDNGKRKYILVEMGVYFDSVTKPRIQKVIYSDTWKDGKPTTKNGISQIFKYFKLESYEDTINNLEFKKTKEQEDTLALYPSAKDDYILNYSLDVESQASLLNIDNFNTPFDYKLKIATSSVGETKETTIDLVETFNYLLGLVVKRIEMLKDYLVVEGQNLKKEKILIIWRDGQSSDELNEFFKKMDWSVYDREFDTIYVNGDNNLDNLRLDEDHFKVKLIEQEFKRLMFNE